MTFSDHLDEYKITKPFEIIGLLDEYIFQNQVSQNDLEVAYQKYTKLSSTKTYLKEPELIRWLEEQEFNVLVYIANGDYVSAENKLSEIYNAIQPGDTLSIHKSEAWLVSRLKERQRVASKKKNTSGFIRWSVITVVILWVSVASFLDSDAMVIARANPNMIDLADRAGMSDKAKAIFVRSNPQYVDSATMQEVCSGTGIISDTTSLGCFSPSENRIYIRDLPEELNDGEVVTVAHEMLHAAANLNGIESIKTALASQHTALINDKTYKSSIEPYVSLSEDVLPFEQAAIFGTEFASLNSELELYYSDYFTDSRSSVVSANSNMNQIIDTKVANLEIREKNINTLFSNAEQYYSYHSYAASTGNRANYNYYYSKYTESYNAYSAEIDSYNSELNAYQQLISDLLGKQIQPIETKSIE